MTEHKKEELEDKLTNEQEELLDSYLQKLEHVFEQLKLAETLQVEIEIEHLKKILSR